MTINDLVVLRDDICAQHALQEFEVVDHALARQIGLAIADIAEQESLPVVVAVNKGEQLVFHAAFDGTTAAHDGWVRRKRRTTLVHDLASLEVVVDNQISGRRPDWLDPREFAMAGGAVPLRVSGSIVGVVAVSGLTQSARADHDLVMRGLREVRA